MRWKTLRDLILARVIRYRRVRVRPVAGRATVSCPLLQGFLREAEDCNACQYNLGIVQRRWGPVRRCGYGIPAAPAWPRWVEALLSLYRRLPRPRPTVPARFQWRRSSSRPISKIEQRRLERRRRFEQERAARHRAWIIRERALQRSRESG
ncbi:MAG: hypothetical protein KatS3mg115_1749 [Candidatus Poribacteria bacterium]|nr:MAG: hypothetical protein KatS3mg115_1749 [Candidatus Poribacteria bacterium]